MSQLRAIVGCNLRKGRKLIHCTQADVVKLADISISYLSLLEAGKRDLNLDVMERLCIALRCDPSWLVTDWTQKEE